MVRSLKVRRKVKKTYSKRSHAVIDLAPTKTFYHFNDFFRTEIDKKEVAKIIKKHLKLNFSRQDAKLMLTCPDWKFTACPFVAATIAWKETGKEFPVDWRAEHVVKKYFDDLRSFATRPDTTTIKKSSTHSKSMQEIVKEKSTDFIVMLEIRLDDRAYEDFSIYEELLRLDAAYNTAKAVVDFYKPLFSEYDELVHKNTADLEEAYSEMSKAEKRASYEFVRGIIEDAERYMARKKATRKSRTSKSESVYQQVKNIKYLKDSSEYRLTSVDPILLIGSSTIFTFSTKDRTLTEYVSDRPEGFSLSGSTLRGLDSTRSRETKLRKPRDFLKTVQQESRSRIHKAWSSLTTKTKTPNGRINKYTILLRILNT